MREVEQLADLVERVVEGDPWHGPTVVALLDGMPARDAAAHVVPGAHSIWELVLHMTGWTREVQARLDGEAGRRAGRRRLARRARRGRCGVDGRRRGARRQPPRAGRRACARATTAPWRPRWSTARSGRRDRPFAAPDAARPRAPHDLPRGPDRAAQACDRGPRVVTAYRRRCRRSGLVPGPPRGPGGFSQFVPGPPAGPGGLWSRSRNGRTRAGLAPGPPRGPGGFSQFVPGPPRGPGGLLAAMRVGVGRGGADEQHGERREGQRAEPGK